MAAAVGRLQWSALASFGAIFGWVVGRLLRIRRTQVEEAMRRAGVDSPALEASAMYRSLGTSVFEFLWLAARGDAAVRHAAIDPASRVRWQNALASNRGVVVAASHTGNWDLAACAMARTIELMVVTKRLTMRSLDRFWQATRARQGVALVSGRGVLAHARKVLHRGGAVAMMIDQVPETRCHGTRVAFLGESAWVDRAPATLAARTGAPLVVAASRRTPSGEHVLEVLDVLEPPARAGRGWIDEATREATRALDRFVRAHPSQWLWLHRRWREPLDRQVDPRPWTATLPGPWKIRSSSQAERSRAV